MPARDVVELAVQAERLGYDYCMVADEGVHPDIYACLGAAALRTERIRLGVMTNGYTRHPAVTAAALATVNELSNGRVVATVLAGGSMVLGPMAIERVRPYRVVEDTIVAVRALWTGEEVTWEGTTCSLDHARLGMGPQHIPLWIASRGPMVLGLAGRVADGVVLTVKPDLGAAISVVDQAAADAGREPPTPMYLGRICYTTEMLEAQRRTLSFVLMDSPRRTLESLHLDPHAIETVQTAAKRNEPALVDPLVTDTLLERYQVAGSPAECSAELAAMVENHGLSTVLIDALSDDLHENLEVMGSSLSIIRGATQ
ncbi:MAG: LLM class flavin-dependent oxidoreductase [Acidimicrobiales bacterium]